MKYFIKEALSTKTLESYIGKSKLFPEQFERLKSFSKLDSVAGAELTKALAKDVKISRKVTKNISAITAKKTAVTGEIDKVDALLAKLT